MVRFVNIREFKTNTESVLKQLGQTDIVLTVRGKPEALLHKISERDLSLKEEFTSEEWNKLEKLAKGPGKVYSTGAEFLKSLRKR